VKTVLVAGLLGALVTAAAFAWSFAADEGALDRAIAAWGIPGPAVSRVNGWLEWVNGWVPLGERRGRAAQVMGLVELRSVGMTRAAPLALLAMAAILARAWARRLDLAGARRVPSPAAAYLAKRGACAVVVVAGAGMCSPLPLPGWSVYAAAVGVAWFTGAYLANLPERV
jgi:hypothetical protein